MGLREYKRKRHFNRTPEPAGKEGPPEGYSFVIQKHAARNLHYDFRLELEGVLKSWAVPKGPSLDPSIKRLAMHVEDHPVEYGSFEGTIPQGEYGGGTVMLWDRGSWEPIGDPHEGYRKGRLKFALHGDKLGGTWMLVRKGETSQYGTGKKQWLLFKLRDEEARPKNKWDVLDKRPLSVKTGRTLAQIARDEDSVWSSNRESKSKPRAARAARANGKARRRNSSSAPAGLALAAIEYDANKKEFAAVRLTSPEKILYPEQGITKLELASYYKAIADWILPHVVDRPLVLVRCPEGRQKDCFYQKHPAFGTPETFRQIPIRESTKTENYLIVDDIKGLISLAQIGALEVHAWGSRADKLEFPDRLIFDLDPGPSVSWTTIVDSARQVRQFLNDLGLQTFLKTTGGKGLHLVAPIDRRHDWDEVKVFCKRIAEVIVLADSRRYTANMAKTARTGKIFIDYLRNARGATAIVPYSTRARPGGPVSAPLSWHELSARIRSDHYTIRNVVKRLTTLKHDPWEEMRSLRQSLTAPMKRLQSLSRR